jgi:Ca2+-binding RTX toxin-like protein
VDWIFSKADFTLSADIENLSMAGGYGKYGAGNALDNVIIGGANILTLLGFGGNDTLTGNAFNDLLDGGTGADTMIGAKGNDTYYVDNVGDVVVELFGEGLDTVLSSIDYALTAGVEKLTLLGSAVLGTGNELSNTMMGSSLDNILRAGAGNDSVSGGAGADRLEGGTGNDTLLGGEGNDTVFGDAGIDTIDGGVGADRMEGGADGDSYVVDHVGDLVIESTAPGTDTVSSSLAKYTLTDNVENLVLLAGAVEGTGNGLINRLTGNDGNNALHGLGGNDILRGEAGLDRIEGGEGADTLYGGAGFDILDGGLGADRMEGGEDNDTYIVDHSGDLVIENADGGTGDRVETSITLTLSANVERLSLLGAANINGSGNVLGNQIVGNSGDNILRGFEGMDNLSGGAGNDRLYGGADTDILTGGGGSDLFVFDTAGGWSNNDLIKDFSVEDDLIVLSAAIFGFTVGSLDAANFAIGAATSNVPTMIYNSTSGQLAFDSNGSASGGLINVATFSANPDLSASDFVIV